jgi:hypothetical protein
MAKIVEDVVIIKLSKIVKDIDSDQSAIVTPEIQAALEQVTQELVGDSIVVEAVKA